MKIAPSKRSNRRFPLLATESVFRGGLVCILLLFVAVNAAIAWRTRRFQSDLSRWEQIAASRDAIGQRSNLLKLRQTKIEEDIQRLHSLVSQDVDVSLQLHQLSQIICSQHLIVEQSQLASVTDFPHFSERSFQFELVGAFEDLVGLLDRLQSEQPKRLRVRHLEIVGEPASGQHRYHLEVAATIEVDSLPPNGEKDHATSHPL